MTRIVTRASSPADAEVLMRHGLHPVIARLYASRGVSSPDEIETELKKMHAPAGLKGCEDAAVVLADALAATTPDAGRRRLRLRRRDRLRRRRARPAHVRRADRLSRAEPLRIRLWADARDRRTGRAPSRRQARPADHGGQRHRERRRRRGGERARHRRARHRPPLAGRPVAARARDRQSEPAGLLVSEQVHRGRRRDVLRAARAAGGIAPPQRVHRRASRAAPRRPARPGRARHGRRCGEARSEQPHPGRAGPEADSRGPHAARRRGAVSRGRARCARRVRLRHRLRARAAPERGGTARGHVARHRVPDDRRHRPRLGTRAAARLDQPRAARDRSGHAAAGARRPPVDRCRRPRHAHAVQSGLASGRDRDRRGAAEGALSPAVVHVRARRRQRRAVEGFRALDSRLPPARRAST